MLNTLKKYISIKGLLMLVLTFMLFYYSVLFQYIPIIIFNIDLNTLSESTRVLLSLFSNTILALILIFIFWKQLKIEFKIFKDKLEENLDCGIKYWLVGLFIMMASNILIGLFTSATGADNEKAIQSMISALPWIMVINAGLIAPISEELIFRKNFKMAFPNKWLFIIISSLIFGWLHVSNATTLTELLYIIPYGALGAAFAFMYSKTNTVFTSISMHMLHNTVLTLLSILI